MGAPLYFFAGRAANDIIDPTTKRLRLAPLQSAGLDGVLADVAPGGFASQEMHSAGPGGKSGFLLIALPPSREAPKRIGFYPRFQDWRQADDDLWIGIDREEPPVPADLRRDGRLHDGYTIELADGKDWTVPVVRRPAAIVGPDVPASGLPHDIGWDRSGRFVQTLKAQYQQLWDDTAELCEVFAGEGGKYSIGIESGLDWAVRLLGLNYRFGRHEQNLLHPIDAANVFSILGLAVDFPLYRALVGAEKKTEDHAAPPASTMPTGSPDDSQAIDRAAANST